VFLSVFALGACGGSSTTTPTQTAASDEVASVVNTAVTNMIQILQTDNPAGNVAAQTTDKTAIDPLTCEWFDQDGNPLVPGVGTLDQVAKWVCESTSCTNADGTETVTITNTLGTPFFAGTPFADGIIVLNTYANCTVDTICGPATLGGTLTITGTGFLTVPCDATVTIVSNDMVVDGTTAASVNMTMNVTAAGSCDAVTTVTCDANLSTDSTMTVGGTTYNKTQICDMVNNPTCP